MNAIASDVLKVFAEQRFFEDLGDRMCPEDHDLPCLSCKGRFAISANILANADFDADDISDITAVLQSKGACCDCQALYNLAPQIGVLEVQSIRRSAPGSPLTRVPLIAAVACGLA